MKLNKRVATADEKDYMVRAINWCKRTGANYGGFPYTDELASSSGIYFELLVTDKSPDDDCLKALEQAFRARDIVSHRTVICPVEWFE